MRQRYLTAVEAGSEDMMRAMFRIILWDCLAMAAAWATGLHLGIAV